MGGYVGAGGDISDPLQKKEKSLARVSLATTFQARPVVQARCSGEACPRQAPQRPSLDHCTYLNGIAIHRALRVCCTRSRYPWYFVTVHNRALRLSGGFRQSPYSGPYAPE